MRTKCWFFQILVSYSLGFWGWTILWFALKPSSSFVCNVFALFYFEPRWTPHDEFYSLERCNNLRPWQSSDVLFGALVDASGRVELYGITDQSIDPDRLVCTSRISILEVSTPICWLCKIPSCHCWKHQLCEKQMLIPSSSCNLLVRFLGSDNFVVCPKNIVIFRP